MMRVSPLCGLKSCVLVFAVLALAACATPGAGPGKAPGGTAAHYKVGKPYQVNGRWYYPKEDPYYDAIGVASWYGDQFHGRPTANGERFDMDLLSAAHTTLPLPSIVEIENLENGRRAIVRVNDRGPFVDDRLIDLSRAAARELGFERQGLARVRVRYVGRAELADLAPRSERESRAMAARAERGGKAADRSAPAPQAAITVARAATAPVEAAPIGTAPAPVAQVLAVDGPGRDGTPDIIAQLIGEAEAEAGMAKSPASAPSAAGPAPSPATPAVAAPPVWIDVKAFADLAALDAAQLSLAKFGPARVRSTSTADGAFRYLLQLGPFADPAAAEARLAALREAGYGDARIADETRAGAVR